MIAKIVKTDRDLFEAYVDGTLAAVTHTWDEADAAVREYRVRVLAQGPVGTGFDPMPTLTAYILEGNESDD